MREVKTEPNLKNRIIATGIDYSIYFAIWFFYIYSFGEPNSKGGYTISGLRALPLFAAWFIYFPIIESFKGNTLGHFIVGLRITDKSGDPIDIIQAFKRRLLDPVDFAFFGLVAFITVKNSKKHQRVGDMLAGTITVGGEPVVCRYCGEKLKLLPDEKLKGRFSCPECKKENEH